MRLIEHLVYTLPRMCQTHNIFKKSAIPKEGHWVPEEVGMSQVPGRVPQGKRAARTPEEAWKEEAAPNTTSEADPFLI